MTPEFDKWWDDETSIEPHPTNNFREDSAAYWAYEGWVRGVAAEREACALMVERGVGDWRLGKKIAAHIRARGDA